MNTLDRIEKLIDEYRFKIDDIDVLISSAKEERKYYKSDGPRSNEIRGELAKLNAQRQAYVKQSLNGGVVTIPTFTRWQSSRIGGLCYAIPSQS